MCSYLVWMYSYSFLYFVSTVWKLKNKYPMIACVGDVYALFSRTTTITSTDEPALTIQWFDGTDEVVVLRPSLSHYWLEATLKISGIPLNASNCYFSTIRMVTLRDPPWFGEELWFSASNNLLKGTKMSFALPYGM